MHRQEDRRSSNSVIKHTVSMIPPRSQLVNSQQSPMKRSSHLSNLFASSRRSTATKRRSNLQMESSSIRLAVRSSSYQFDEKQRIYFDEIFSKNESTLSIAEKITDQCLRQGRKKTLILLCGQYREVHPLQTHLISVVLTKLFHLSQEHLWNLCYSWEDFSLEDKPIEQIPCQSPNETLVHLNNIHSEHRSHPILLTFTLRSRSTNQLVLQYQFLSTHDHDSRFAHLFFSWILTRQVKSSPKSVSSRPIHRSTFFEEYFLEQNSNNNDSRFIYLIGNVKHAKHVKIWSKISRIVGMDRKFRHRPQPQQQQHTRDEIWIDGPLSSSSEIWIDGPPIRSSRRKSPMKSSRSHSSKPSSFSPPLSSTILNDNSADTESIISSHCHLPVLPVFKDHSLLPFRSTLPRKNDSIETTNTTKLNEEMENLEKALERFVIPQDSSSTREDNLLKSNSSRRIDRLSSLMSHEEKNKRLSRILSPTRFDQLLMQTSFDATNGSSVPTSPLLQTRTHHPAHSTPLPRTPAPAPTPPPPVTTHRPSLFQRLFGFRNTSTLIESSSSVPPLITPLTVTLDSQDDLMPLTTSSAASSASGRASSSGYESMSNTVFDDILPIHQDKQRSNRLVRRTRFDLPENTTCTNTMMKKRLHRQQRLSQLKRRQNELNFELTLTKNQLLKSTIESQEAQPSIRLVSPNHHFIPNDDDDDEEEKLEREIEYLERRLTAAKNHLLFFTCQKK